MRLAPVSLLLPLPPPRLLQPSIPPRLAADSTTTCLATTGGPHQQAPAGCCALACASSWDTHTRRAAEH